MLDLTRGKQVAYDKDKWDVDVIMTMFREINVLQNGNNEYVLHVRCSYLDLGMVYDCMVDAGNGYLPHLLPLHQHGWYHSCQPGVLNDMVSTALVGMKPASADIPSFMSDNPHRRHNIAHGPRGLQEKDQDGNLINVQELPYAVHIDAVPAYVPNAGSVLVIGCGGSGSEVRACMEQEVSVVGVDNDPKQMTHLLKSLTTYKQNRGVVDPNTQITIIRCTQCNVESPVNHTCHCSKCNKKLCTAFCIPGYTEPCLECKLTETYKPPTQIFCQSDTLAFTLSQKATEPQKGKKGGKSA